MNNFLPIIFMITSIGLFFLNILAFMRLIPIIFTLPLFFLSLYLLIYTTSYRHMYRGMK